NECGAGAWVGPFVFATASKNCVTLVSNDVPKVISSNGTPTVESKIQVSSSGPISEIKVKTLEGNHTFFKDLTASLVSPAGTAVVLFDKKCASYSGNFKLGFDDEAPQAFGCPPPQNGNAYRPEGKLSAFANQEAAGEWKLRIKDNTISSGGQISAFAIEFCSSAALNPPLIVQNKLLQVGPGQNAVVLNTLLKAEDLNTPPAQLVFTLVSAPQYGHLERAWTGPMLPGQQFTQTDLDNGAIRYFDHGIPNAGDTFRFSVTDGEGGLAADIFQVQQFPLDTREVGNALAFSLAPNPATESVRLSLPEALAADAQLQLYSATGQLLRSWSLPAGQTAQVLVLDGVPAGVYLVTLQSGTEMGVRRLSKR
ncbi:MAG: proprotein convertase P-domain-containing protein, partial [Saprospiraceae bacterium]|nr:proprotein convertase P-domain-containing protein [Saprospiraceae bacterium]